MDALACLCFRGAATLVVVLLVTIFAPLAGTAGDDFANAGAEIAMAPSTINDTSDLFMIGSPSVFGIPSKFPNLSVCSFIVVFASCSFREAKLLLL